MEVSCPGGPSRILPRADVGSQIEMRVNSAFSRLLLLLLLLLLILLLLLLLFLLLLYPLLESSR